MIKVFRKIRHEVYVWAADHHAVRDIRKQYPAVTMQSVSKGKDWVLKYRFSQENESFFLRVFPVNMAPSAKRSFETAKQLSLQDCSVLNPLSVKNSFLFTYYIEPWIDGMTLREYVIGLSEEQKYQTGVLAGQVLHTFHQAEIRQPLVYLNDRLQQTLNKLRESPYDLFGLKESFLSSLEFCLSSLQERPQAVLQGDCHLNNLMITTEGKLYITDLECMCLGDPYFDLTCLMEKDRSFFSFNKGLLKGYSQISEDRAWEIIGIYQVIRKIEEYLYYIHRLPDYLASRESWEMRLELLRDPELVKASTLGAGSVYGVRQPVCVSVVAPVWNPGPEIVRFLEAVQNQTLKETELIFVDDCGSDGAMDQIRDAAKEDARIRVIVNPQNLGPGPSRNAGLEAARGEYVAFLDPDDYISPDFLERLYTKAEKEHLDIVKGRCVYLKEDGSAAPHQEQNEVIRKGLADGKPPYVLFTYEHHNAIYRRALLMTAGARYGNSRRSQDTTFLLRACYASKSLGIEDAAIYYFCERQDSAMHRFTVDSLEYRLTSFREQVDFLTEHLSDDPYASSYVASQYQGNLKFYSFYEKSVETKRALRRYREGMREEILRLPFAERLKKHHFSIRLLLDYGIALPSSPCLLPWETAHAEDWLAVFHRWVKIFLKYPECREYGMYPFTGIYEKTGQICEAEARDPDPGISRKAVRARKTLKKQFRKLPGKVRRRMRMTSVHGHVAGVMPDKLKTLIRSITQG